jgi:glutamate synthase (NADPH/NADH) large chain
VQPDPAARFAAEDQIIAGNVLLYGATSGEVYLRGLVGERFAVRNSGATAVTEGVGDHGLEYMTGGRVIILGTTGRNLAAGMSGGIAYVLDLEPRRVNPEMVEIETLTDEDLAFVRATVEKHLEETGSTVAAKLLAEWETSVTRFSKIMPRDYKRVLLAMAAAEAEGRDVDEAVMAAAQS